MREKKKNQQNLKVGFDIFFLFFITVKLYLKGTTAYKAIIVIGITVAVIRSSLAEKILI